MQADSLTVGYSNSDYLHMKSIIIEQQIRSEVY